MEFQKYFVDEFNCLFSKYFVDEFNCLFNKYYEELSDSDEDIDRHLKLDTQKILFACFLNSGCPDEFIKEVSAYPWRYYCYSQQHLEVKNFENIDELIEYVHESRKLSPKELKIVSPQCVYALAKQLVDGCEDSDDEEFVEHFFDIKFFIQYKIFKD
jgi:hypothetical protein